MDRKYRVLLLCLLLVLLAGGAGAQLPIYQQWSQTYEVGGYYRVAKLDVEAVRSTDSVTINNMFIVSVQMDTSYYAGGGLTWRSASNYLCLVDSSQLLWQRYLGSNGSFNGMPPLGYNSKPVHLQNGNVSVKSAVGRYNEYTLTGDSATSFVIPGPGAGVCFGDLIETSRGRVSIEWNLISLFSQWGQLIDTLDGNGTGLSFGAAERTGDNGVFVIRSGVNTSEIVVLDSNLNVISANPTIDGRTPLQVTRSPSGQIYTLSYGVGGVSSSRFSVKKYSPEGEYLTEREYVGFVLRQVGPHFVVTSDSTICVFTIQGIPAFPHYYLNFYNEELDSLGRVELESDVYSICADNSGGIVVADPSPIGRHFDIKQYGSMPTALHDLPLIPDNYSISTYPNPFNSQAVIRYEMVNAEDVSLRIFDITGRQVATLVDEFKDPGTYTVTFDASALPSGVYVYAFDSGNFSHHGKLLLLK